MRMLTAAIIGPPTEVPRTEKLAFTLVTNPADPETLRSEWLRLLEQSDFGEVTQTPDWQLLWWRVYGELDGRELRLGVFRAGEQLVGLAPLLRRRHWYRGCLPFGRLEFLASGEATNDGIYSNHLNI